MEAAIPFESQNQAKAMFAAAAGHSTLGIPKKVGQEFVGASGGMKVGKLPKFKKPKAPGTKGATPFGSLAPGMGDSSAVPAAPPLPSPGDTP